MGPEKKYRFKLREAHRESLIKTHISRFDRFHYSRYILFDVLPRDKKKGKVAGALRSDDVFK